MRKLISFFVDQHLFGDLLTVAVIALGFYSAMNIRREAFPNIQFDVISVVTLFPGASPEEVERLITNPLEQEIKEVDGIKKMLSTSLENRSGIVVYLDPDQTTEQEGKVDVQDVVDRADADLPEDAEEPSVVSVGTKQAPVIEVSISGEGITPLELRSIAKRLEEELERVPGVARIVHRGLRDLEIRVEADVAKLARYRLSLDDVILALKRQNLSIPGGTIEVNPNEATGRERIVRTVGEFRTAEDVRATVVRANELGEPILVRDVAKVFMDLEEPVVTNRTNGLAALSLTVLKKENADAITVVDKVKDRMEELKPKLDSRLHVDFINDMSYYVRRRLGILTSNLSIGLGMVLLMLPLLIPFRFALLIALGEPFAFLGTILIMYLFGFSINLIGMIGLIIVSGILVDDSIVVTENAVRRVEEGEDPKVAAVEGTLQIMPAVTASVLSTASAFLPMAFMSGIFGKFIIEVPIAVLTALGVSLIETYFVLPAHIAHWIKPQTQGSRSQLERSGPVGKFLKTTRDFWDVRIVPIYLSWLRAALRRRYWVAVGLVFVMVGSFALARFGMKLILFPPEGVEIFFIRTEAPTGTSLGRHELILKTAEQAVAALPKEEVENFTTAVGIQQQDPNDPETRRGSEYGQIAVFLTPETARSRSAQAIMDDLRVKIGIPAGLERVAFSRVNPGPPQGRPVSLEVRADNYDKIMPVAKELKEILAKFDGVTDIQDNYTMGKEELRVQVNSAEAAAAGLSVANIGNTVRAAYEGIVATQVRELSEEIDVRVSFPPEARAQASTIGQILIPNPMGNLVPLSRVAKVTKDQALATYEHKDNQRQINVTADVDVETTTSTEVNGRIREMLPELNRKHPEVSIGFGGEAEDTEESMASLFRAFILAVMGIYLIQVLTFKNLLQPLVILLTIPLGVIAVIWAFFLHGLPFSFLGMLGIIALSGVIVNNAIVLVDFVNQARAEGMGKMESIIEGSSMRVRPIFLTTVTTVIGIMPTAYGIGGLDKFVVPIAMALAWGLMFGSILTAFVFPAALAILDDFQSFFGSKFRRKKAEVV